MPAHAGGFPAPDDFADERLPYWVELWPASLTLADWLLEQQEEIRGRFCLDLGCGLGLTALAAQSLGARVLAVDYEEEALGFARLNALENRVESPAWAVMDWRVPAFKKQAFDFIWGGDIMYERRFVTPVLDLLGYALAPGGRVWLAEPNRNVYDDFRAALLKRGWNSTRVREARESALYAQKEKVGVSLWELS
jgi:predicted nicotinamide N-methyase